jgi:fibronectin-binding autotransporter adhesin
MKKRFAGRLVRILRLSLGSVALAAVANSGVVKGQTDYYFSGSNGGSFPWDFATHLWSTTAPPPNSASLIAWADNNIAHVDGFGPTGLQATTRNLTLLNNISVQSLIFDYGTSGTNNYTGLYKLLNKSGSTLNLNINTGNITENALTGNNAQFATALINNNVTTPAGVDLTFLATGTYQNTGAFGNTELDLAGSANAFHDIHIGAGIKGPASASPSNLVVIADSNGLMNANDMRVADVYLDGNGAGLSAVNPGVVTPVTVNANNIVLNQSALTYTPGAFIGRLGANNAGIDQAILDVNGVISGNGDLMFANGFSGGGGKVVLNNHNTYAGTTTFNGSGGGTTPGQGLMWVQLGIDNALPATTVMKWGFNTNGNGGEFDLNGHNQEVSSLFTPFTAGNSVITNSSFSGSSLSTLTISGSDSPGPFNMAITDNSTIGGGKLALVRSGTGTTVLTNVNSSYGGGTTILGGTLSVSADAELGTVMPLVGTNNLVINGGTLAVTGAGFTLNSSRPVSVGPTSGSGPGMISVAANSSLTYNGSITNNGGVGELELTGNGTLILGGVNSYTGPTTIKNGTLSLATGSTLDLASAVAVNLGGTLAGTGTASGSVTVSGTIAPGTATSSGQLNVGSLALSSGGAYNWKLLDGGSSPGNGWDLVNVTGSLALNSTSGNRFTINVLPGPGGVVSNFDNSMTHSYEIAASSSLSGNPFNANLFNINTSTFGAGSPGSTFSISHTGGNLFLDYTPGPGALVWKQPVGGTGNWFATGGTDWSGGAWNSAKLADFNAGSGIVTLQNPITSQGLEFDVTGYTVAGSGANTLVAPIIHVTNSGDSATVSAQLVGTNLTKTGAGTLILTGPNSFSGTTTISSGKLQASTANLPTDIVINGTLIFDQAIDGTFSHSLLSGGGSLIKQNVGTLTLTGTNTGYTGPVTINGGSIRVDSDARLGGPVDAPATLTLNGGTLAASAGFSSVRGISVGDMNNPSATGALDTAGFTVTLNGSTSSTSQINLNNGGTFIKKGAGELVLLGAGTDTSTTSVIAHSPGGQPGTIQVDGGTLTLGNKADPNSNPQTFFGPTTLPNNLVLNDGTTFQTAASTTANASINTMNSLTVNGNVKIMIYRTTADGGNSQSPSYTVDGNTSTPLTLNGTLTIDGGGTLALSTPRVTVGALTVNGPSTIQTVANATFQTNFSVTGVINDNGNPLTFKGGGTATQLPGNSIRFSTPAATSFVSGNWTIGTPDGTQGVALSYGGADNTAFTTGSITVNPYGQLFISSTSQAATTPFQVGTPGQTLTLNGIGAQLADFSAGFSGALATGSGNFDEYRGDLVLASDSVITVAGAAGQLTLDGTIAGPGLLQKQGAGTLIIHNSGNTHPNNVLVGNGTIMVGDGAVASFGTALLPPGNLTLGETTPTPGTVDSPLTTAVVFQNVAQSIGNLASTFAVTSGYATQTITLAGTSDGGTVLTINETGNTSFGVGAVSTLNSTITGPGSVVLGSLSTGTLTLTSTNDYTGGTTINGGKLELAGAPTVGAIFGGDVAINSNGILGVNTAANLIAGNPTPPAGANTNATALVNSGGTMSIDSDFDAGRLVDPNSVGILALNTNNSMLSGTNGSSAFIGAFGAQLLTVAALAPGAGGTYRLGGRGGSLTVTQGILVGPANSLVIGSTQPNGSGTVILAAANTFGGGTTVNNGTLRTTADGALSTGSLAVNATATASSTASIQSNETVSSLSSSVAAGGSATLTVVAGKMLTDNQAGNTTFAGVVALKSGASPGGGGTLVKSGAGTLEINGAPLLGSNSSVQVTTTGRLKFNVSSGTTSVGTGATAIVSNSAVLELAGSMSALGTATAGRADITNTSTAAAGLLVTGTHQQVGGINGTGTTQVNAGSDLTANHIIQTALAIGGTSGMSGRVTIAPSDSSGNPLVAAPDLATSDGFAAGLTPSAGLLGAGGGADGLAPALSSGSAIGGNGSAVPEPSTIGLALLAVLAIGAARCRERGGLVSAH